MAFFTVLESSARALFEIFLIIGLGFFLVKKKVLPQGSPLVLSYFIVIAALPALILSKVVGGPEGGGVGAIELWWLYPILGVVMILGGIALGLIPARLDRKVGSPRELLSMTGFANAGYLPLPLVMALFPKALADELVIAIILFVVIWNFLLWSLGVFLLSGDAGKSNLKASLGKAINPPFLAIIISLLISRLGLGERIPAELMGPIAALGDCTIPVIMIALGGMLAEIDLGRDLERRTMGYLIGIKLLLMPAIALLIVWGLKPPAVLGIMLVMQAAMPPATTLPIIARMYGGNDKVLSQTVFFSYLASMITLPVFMSLALSVLGVAL